jgi:hypothetical protein
MFDHRKAEALFKQQCLVDLKEYLDRCSKNRKLPRKNKHLIASFYRKMGFPYLGVKLLAPIIRSEKPLEAPGDGEKIEYAACLYRIGLAMEAQKLLASIEEDGPQKLLYLSFVLFSNWNYAAAIPILIKYLKRPCLTDREHFIGQLNLSAAYIFEGQYQLARNLLEICERYALKEDLNRYLGNILELKAQVHYHSNEDQLGKACLKRSLKLFKSKNEFGYLFSLKWLAIFELKTKPALYQSVLEMAYQRRHWETIRSLNYYKAKVLGDQHLMSEVYLGTPYQSFRQMILRENPGFEFKLENLRFGVGQFIYDQKNKSIINQNKQIRVFKGFELEQRLLDALCADYYRPKTAFQLFQYLYPDEYFLPSTSLNKTQQVISRFNKSIYCIEFDRPYYQLNGICVHYSPFHMVEKDQYLRILKESRESEFKSSEVAALFNISQRQATRVLKKLVNQRKLAQIKKGRSSYYKLIA